MFGADYVHISSSVTCSKSSELLVTYLLISGTRPKPLLFHTLPSRLKHSFLQHVQILWMMTFQNLERSVQHVISILKTKWEEQVFSPGSKNSVYHPLHSKLHSDYLKKTILDLNFLRISGRAHQDQGCNFVRCVMDFIMTR
jgi:hypothetical protein